MQKNSIVNDMQIFKYFSHFNMLREPFKINFEKCFDDYLRNFL